MESEEKNDRTALFSKMFRELEAEIGTTDLARLVIASLGASIKTFKAENAQDFCAQFDDLVEIISSTEPKFGILNHHFARLDKEFACTFADKDILERKWKKYAHKQVAKVANSAKKGKKRIIEMSEKIEVEGKTILIHDHSHTVQDVLVNYRKHGKKFQVVIAEQDFEKTYGNIERMHKAKIPFQVVPSYMLSHVHEQIDMLFFGGLTLKDSMHFVMDPGTHSIISEFNIEKTPVYMFIDTAKFSLWPSKKRGEIFIHAHKRRHHNKDILFDRIKYSHDRVPAELFKGIVTNEGVFSPVEVKKLFDKKLKKEV